MLHAVNIVMLCCSKESSNAAATGIDLGPRVSVLCHAFHSEFYPSVCLFICPICMTICVYVCVSVCLYVCVCLSVHMTVCSHVSLSVC